MAAAQIPADIVAMMARGISVIAASRDALSRPSVMRAVGSLVEDDAGRITIFVSRRQSAQLVQDVSSNGHIAVVFSEPATHRTVQVKATNARIRNADASDQAALSRYLASMEIEIARVGYGPHMTRAMLAHRLEDLVAITFAPEQAFDQTPGPKAGAAFGAGRA
ncbi:MAG: pyridoxamine 5'-phosphate oxidase family protein [Pseudomonadota bacterium]